MLARPSAIGAFRINAEAPGVLAEICNEKDAKLIHFSTDYVFDGEKRAPYTEEDQANPISAYGESKLAGEKKVLAADNGHLVVRVSWVFGPDRPSFIDAMIKRAQQDEKIDAISDKFSTPTYTHDIARDVAAIFRSRRRRRHFAFRKCRQMHLAGIRAMGAGLLP